MCLHHCHWQIVNVTSNVPSPANRMIALTSNSATNLV